MGAGEAAGTPAFGRKPVKGKDWNQPSLDACHGRTGRRAEEEPVDTVYYLDIPTALSPGEYAWRLIVYDSATLSPTVEPGVWEGEVALARLRLADGG